MRSSVYIIFVAWPHRLKKTQIRHKRNFAYCDQGDHMPKRNTLVCLKVTMHYSVSQVCVSTNLREST